MILAPGAFFAAGFIIWGVNAMRAAPKQEDAK
jgi:Na+-transporting NADH:ubiquinone oxidoreductase subunit NqrD